MIQVFLKNDVGESTTSSISMIFPFLLLGNINQTYRKIGEVENEFVWYSAGVNHVLNSYLFFHHFLAHDEYNTPFPTRRHQDLTSKIYPVETLHSPE